MQQPAEGEWTKRMICVCLADGQISVV